MNKETKNDMRDIFWTVFLLLSSFYLLVIGVFTSKPKQDFKQEIVDYFCDDLKGATCVYDACWKELHKRQEMCNKVK